MALGSTSKWDLGNWRAPRSIWHPIISKQNYILPYHLVYQGDPLIQKGLGHPMNKIEGQCYERRLKIRISLLQDFILDINTLQHLFLIFTNRLKFRFLSETFWDLFWGPRLCLIQYWMPGLCFPTSMALILFSLMFFSLGMPLLLRFPPFQGLLCFKKQRSLKFGKRFMWQLWKAPVCSFGWRSTVRGALHVEPWGRHVGSRTGFT